MSRYRLRPSPAQEAIILGHCAHARYVWNLCVEQESHWRPGRGKMPGFAGRCRQLSEARAAEPWLAAGSVIVQQQAIRRVEDLYITNMTRSAKGTVEEPGRNVRAKAGLNRGILGSGWGLLVRREQDKAPGRVEKVRPAYTSQRCSACGHIAAGSRESQALFRCVACGYACNADVNAARNIAAGHAVTARGGFRNAGPANREPQPVLLPS
jgi:putative transposase